MVSRSQFLHVAMMVLGVALVGAALFLLGQPEYSLRVDRVSEGTIPAGATVLQFEDLSADGQDAVRRAVESSDGRTAVRAGNRPPAFSYGDASGDHYVVLDGEYYRVTTDGGGVLADVDELLAYVLLAFGGVAVLAGGVDVYRNRSGTDRGA